MYGIFSSQKLSSVTKEQVFEKHLAPFRVIQAQDKMSIIETLFDDIPWFQCFYNKPLYIYLLADEYVDHMENLQFLKGVKFYYNKIQSPVKHHTESIFLPNQERYFLGDRDRIAEMLTQFVKRVDLSLSPNWRIILSTNDDNAVERTKNIPQQLQQQSQQPQQ